MIEAMVLELESRRTEINEKVETVYWGGGTPSILKRKQLELLCQKISDSFDFAPEVEWTLEANPDDITEVNLQMWRDLGFNRLSIGLQSFKVEDLKWMNRAHTVSDSFNCVPLAQSYGFKNLSIDLMYGLPGLSLEEWEESLQRVISWGVPHISAYCLTVEKRTALYKKVENKEIVPPNDDEQAAQFDCLVETLGKAGYEQYEISNFANKQQYAKHNTAYWQGKPYLGIGPSAHSFQGKTRRFNVANNPQYIKKIKQGEAYFEEEILSAENQFNERIMTGLRTKWGADLNDCEAILKPNPAFYKSIEEFVQKMWMERRDSHLILTQEGRLMADYIASSLFQEEE
jgi:oxygen-independent coproporphyrinogen III oxidase